MKKLLWATVAIVIFLVGCGNDTEPADTDSVPEVEEPNAVTFGNMDLQVEANTFTLTGEVKTGADVFYYRLEQGEEELHGEEVYELESEEGEWREFEITGEVPAAALEEEHTPILRLYSKTVEGEEINPNFIPIDIGE